MFRYIYIILADISQLVIRQKSVKFNTLKEQKNDLKIVI